MSRWFPDPIVFRLGDVPSPSAAVDSVLSDVATAKSTWLDVALAAFEQELDQKALKRGTRIKCIVTGDAARYRIVPWNSELASSAQRQMLAEHCFKEVYGQVVQGWVVRQHAARHGVATLACAIDAALLERIDALAQKHRLKLTSVQPSLMQAFNEAKHPPNAGPYWLVCVDALWATALLMSPFEPLHVKQLSCVGLDLAVALDREAFMLGLDGPSIPVQTIRHVGVPLAGPPAVPMPGACSVELRAAPARPLLEPRVA